MDNGSLVAFRKWLSKSERKQSTVDGWLHLLERVNQLLPEFTYAAFDEYIWSLKREGKKSNYLNNIIGAVKLYGEFIGDEELRGYKLFRKNSVLKQTLSDEEIEAFISVPCFYRRHPALHKKWEMFYKVAFWSGCRLREAAMLTKDDIVFGQDPVLLFRDTKTHEPRQVPIAPAIAKDLQEYVNSLDTHLLFPSRAGRVLTDVSWGEEWRLRLNAIGIGRRPGLTPHSARHSAASRWVPEMSIFSVMDLLGHRNVATTQQYYHGNLKTLQRDILKDPLNRNVRPIEVVLETIANEITNQLKNDLRFCISLKKDVSSLMVNISVKDI